MTAQEIRDAIGKSNSEESYEIILLINNGRSEEAYDRIQGIYACGRETAMEVSRMFEALLRKNQQNNP